MGHGDLGVRRLGSSAGVKASMCSTRLPGAELVQAVKCGQLDRVNALLLRPATGHHLLLGGDYLTPSSLNWQDEASGGTPLYWASCFGYVDLVRTLIDKGSDVNRVNGWRATPLHAAADNNHVRACSVLLKHNADVNAQTVQGDTPCHLAAYRGNQTVVEKLLDSGADITIRNRQSKTSLDEARGSDHTQIVRLMEAYQSISSTLSTFNFADDLVKDKSFVDKWKTIYECSDDATCSIVVPTNCTYHSNTNTYPVCSKITNMTLSDGQSHRSVMGHAHMHSHQKWPDNTAHGHRHASWTGPDSECQTERPYGTKCERRTSDSDLFMKNSDINLDVSMNFNSMDYEAMKDKRYNKDLCFK